MFNSSKLLAVPGLLALLAAAPVGVIAQEAAPPPASEQPSAADLDQQTKQQFAKVYGGIQDIRQEYSMKLQETEDTQKAQDLQQEAQEKMIDVVEDNGMSVSQYNELANLITSDPELLAEIEAMSGQ